MAAKVPTTVTTIGLMHGIRVIQATFDGTVSSNDIDDTDTWASGINGILFAMFVPTTSTGVVGCSNSSGTITFAASANTQIGDVIVFARP